MVLLMTKKNMIKVCKNLKRFWILGCHFGMFYVQLTEIATVGTERHQTFSSSFIHSPRGELGRTKPIPNILPENKNLHYTVEHLCGKLFFCKLLKCLEFLDGLYLYMDSLIHDCIFDFNLYFLS